MGTLVGGVAEDFVVDELLELVVGDGVDNSLHGVSQDRQNRSQSNTKRMSPRGCDSAGTNLAGGAFLPP